MSDLGFAAFQPEPLIEITRSCSRKVAADAHGGPRFESKDFFCSAKSQVRFSDALAAADRLQDFCEEQVDRDAEAYIATLSGVAPEHVAINNAPAPEPTPTHDPYSVEEVSSNASPATVTSAPAAVDEPSRLRAIIMGTVPKCTKKHLASYYAGWFGVETTKDIPDGKNPEVYIEPLKHLLKAVDDLKESREMLTSNPLNLGRDIREAISHIKNDQADGGIAPPELMDGPVKDGEWTEIVDVDPLMAKYGWRDMETVMYAKRLMGKFGHDDAKFADYLKFLRISTMPEGDLLALFRILWHTPLAVTLRNKAETANMTFLAAYEKVEAAMGTPITMQSLSADVNLATQKVISEGLPGRSKP